MANYVELETIINNYKMVYTAWCQKGKRPGITRWHQGMGGRGYTSFGISAFDKPFDIYKECERGQYVDDSRPWLYYDIGSDTIGIYCVYKRKRIDLFFAEKYVSSVPLNAFTTYTNEHHLKAELIPGKLSWHSRDTIVADVLVIKGTQIDFINAGWQVEYDRGIKEKQLKEKLAQEEYKKGCDATRIRILNSMSAIEKAYSSEIMQIMSKYDPFLLNANHISQFRGVFHSFSWDYDIYSQGVLWRRLIGDCDERFMRFSDIGFKPIDTDEQLFAFSMAMFCHKQGINLSELDIEQVEWDCQIIETFRGKRINNPKLIVKDKPVELKPIF